MPVEIIEESQFDTMLAKWLCMYLDTEYMLRMDKLDPPIQNMLTRQLSLCLDV